MLKTKYISGFTDFSQEYHISTAHVLDTRGRFSDPREIW